LCNTYNYTREGADYGTVGRASVADGGRLESGAPLFVCRPAAHGPKESTTLPGAGNCNLEGKKCKGKIE